jgi:hypothetical protein
MVFDITIHYNKRKRKLLVRRVYQDEYTERYAVTDNTTEFIFERTKPVILHMALKPASSWRLLEPRTLYGTIKADIIAALKQKVE